MNLGKKCNKPGLEIRMKLIAKKILIINVYFPEMRESIKRVNCGNPSNV